MRMTPRSESSDVPCWRRMTRQRVPAALMTCLIFLGAHVAAQEYTHRHEGYDRRLEIQPPAKGSQPASQHRAIQAFRAEMPDIRIEVDDRTGATRTITNAMGTLSKPAESGFDPELVARTFLEAQREALGLQPGDLEEMVLVDHVETDLTGSNHFYFQQTHFGIPAYGAQLQVHVGADGSVEGVNNSFLPDLAYAVNALAPSVDAELAVTGGVEHLGRSFTVHEAVETKLSESRRATRIRTTGVRDERVDAELMWLPIAAGDARLVWYFLIDPMHEPSVYEMTVDAITGDVWTRFDQTSTATHRAFLLPRESPYTASGSIPNDGRGVLISLGNPPAGWHETDTTSYTTHRGNNVHAYSDISGFAVPTTAQPDCGVNLSCSFPLHFPSGIRSYTDASISQLFYTVNTVHDTHYRYGFDEQAGNFQEDNFGLGGDDGDPVLALTQGPMNSPLPNTPGNIGPHWIPTRDGTSPRLVMPLWRFDGPPTRDTAWDNLVTVHEYGHGISSRLIGGPDTVSCLNNVQSRGLGEGWSDFLGLWYTAESSDRGTDGRGVGQWAMGEPASHRGLRPQRYSTSNSVNNHTYRTITQDTRTHSVGAVWAQALWEVHWALVDQYGFDSRLKDVWRRKGNHRSMRYVTDGMKRTACNPDFLDARDGVIEAVGAYRGGEDRCLVWDAFAKFGLGTNARSGGSNTYSNVANGFQIPADCCTVSTPTFIGEQGLGPLCQNNAVTYETNADPAVDTYRWEVLNASGSVVRTSATSVPRYSLSGFALASGSYTLRVRAQRSCGAVSGWRSRSIVVQPSTSPACDCNPFFQICGPF